MLLDGLIVLLISLTGSCFLCQSSFCCSTFEQQEWTCVLFGANLCRAVGKQHVLIWADEPATKSGIGYMVAKR